MLHPHAHNYRHWYPAALCLLALPLFFLGIYDVHPWGDDFAQYIQEGLNIAAGRPYYSTAYVFNPQNTVFGPPQYPPGYPALLAPLLKIYGLQIRPLLYENAVFVSGILFCCYFFFMRYTSRLYALCLALVVAYSGHMLELKVQVLSDIPCALFILLYLVLRRDDEQLSARRYVLLVAIGVMAALIRSQYLLLIGAEGLWLTAGAYRHWHTRRVRVMQYVLQQPALKLASAMSIVFLLLNTTLLRAPQSTLGYYTAMTLDSGGLLHQISENSEYLLELFRGSYHYDVGEPVARAFILFVECGGLFLAACGLIISVRQRFRFHHAFFITALAFLLILPVHQGFRFVLPLLPLYVFYTFFGLRRSIGSILTRKPRGVWLTATLLYLSCGMDTYGRYLRPPTEDNPYTASDKAAFAWIRSHISNEDLILFFKPRALTLYTGKRAMVLAWQQPPEKNLEKARAANARYVLVRNGLDEGWYLDFIRGQDIAADSLQINERYRLYRLRQPL